MFRPSSCPENPDRYTLKYAGMTYAMIDDGRVLVIVDEAASYLTVRKTTRAVDDTVGTDHHRMVLAVRRAISADAALRWQMKQGSFRLRLLVAGQSSGHLAARLCLPHLISTRPLPLYRFQRTGVAHLLRSSRVLFADDMGLGKTIQAAAALRILVASGRVRNALVLAPATLVSNWLSELARWVPELVVAKGSPAKQPRAASWDNLMDQSHVIATNYEDFRKAVPTYGCPTVDLLILDEAHRVKNWESLSSRAVRQIDCNRMWALTGTPIERDSKDLTSLLALLDPNAFTSDDAKLSPGVLRSRAGRFVLRREKKDVLAELPVVSRRHERLSMGTRQRSTYHRVGRASSTELNLLAVFSRLREICDYDPETGESVKIDRIVEILQAVERAGEKAVVFSYLLEPLRLLRTLLRATPVSWKLLVGSMNAEERERAIEEFKQQPVVALLASMRVAAEGITLVEANHVIFVNRWWNPSLNQQSVDRVVRIGQTRRVWVHTFTVEGTIEDDLDRLLKSKEALFDEMVGRLSQSTGSVAKLLAEMNEGN